MWEAADAFIIEQQPASNIRMKVISHCMQMYWNKLNPQAMVSFSSAQSALDRVCCVESRPAKKARMTYHVRKARSVQFATHFLGHSAMANVFKGQHKKDDCADALMHGVAWVLRNGGKIASDSQVGIQSISSTSITR
jgi:hypothetical protein